MLQITSGYGLIQPVNNGDDRTRIESGYVNGLYEAIGKCTILEYPVEG